MNVTLVPAYGRDYRSQKEVKAAWDAGQDFQISCFGHPHDGRYINKPQAAGQSYNVRYKRLTQICVVKG